MNDLKQYLETVKFKRKMFGGIDEADVWKVIEELHVIYERLLQKQQIRYETLLDREQRIEKSGKQDGNERSVEQA